MLSKSVLCQFSTSLLSTSSDKLYKLSHSLDTFPRRHCVQLEDDEKSPKIQKMLKQIGVESVSELLKKTIPSQIFNDHSIDALDETLFEKDHKDLKEGESDILTKLKLEYAELNDYKKKSYIGVGYYNTKLPTVILRNVLENPLWYTPYTPYQAEVSQGRLEGLLNFQTMISELTGLKISNASLLDEGTGAAESMIMCYNIFTQKKRKISKKHLPVQFIVSKDCHPQTIGVVKTRAKPFNIEIVEVDDINSFMKSQKKKKDTEKPIIGALFQYPTTYGSVENYKEMVSKLHKIGGFAVCATDLLSLTLLTPPGEVGIDIAIGSNQRFGLPMGAGGPHAGFFATSDKHKRFLPGRIIGVSRDLQGNLAYRMALQTREQHIRRDKATSNICTAQALLANLSGMYGVYHGPEGLKEIANQVHEKTCVFVEGLKKLGYQLFDGKDSLFFDTIKINTCCKEQTEKIMKGSLEKGMNLRKIDEKTIGMSFDECSTVKEMNKLLDVFREASKDKKDVLFKIEDIEPINNIEKSEFKRKSEFMNQKVFNSYHTEHEMLRYLTRLVSKDISLAHSTIPLGSCTMKLNAASEMIPITWEGFGNIHPFAPYDQLKGYQKLFKDMEEWLSNVTGFDGCSLQPNAGSQGEYSGLMTIKKYYEAIGESERDICLIPISAHGTNPASSVMAGLKVVVVQCDEKGNIDTKDLKRLAKKHKKKLAAIMITYPSTHGVFEENVKEIIDCVHENGGQVYLDGANMNAQVGFTSPGYIGADVCHLNLHKTFAIPHGGGGPGVGPICVKKHLIPHLPNYIDIVPSMFNDTGFGLASAAPWGSASILPITWMYLRMMGTKGLKNATSMAIMNANYMAKKLSPYYKIFYTGKNGFCAHEFIVDLGRFKKKTGVMAEDVAKRLMDYGFHAPTLSFPIHETLMVEPTESESLEEIDRLCDSLIQIRKEIQEIEDGQFSKEDNVLHNSPHTHEECCKDEWNHEYPRSKAAYPMKWSKENKIWPTVGRIDNVYGDKNLHCSCVETSAYFESEETCNIKE